MHNKWWSDDFLFQFCVYFKVLCSSVSLLYAFLWTKMCGMRLYALNVMRSVYWGEKSNQANATFLFLILSLPLIFVLLRVLVINSMAWSNRKSILIAAVVSWRAWKWFIQCLIFVTNETFSVHNLIWFHIVLLISYTLCINLEQSKLKFIMKMSRP